MAYRTKLTFTNRPIYELPSGQALVALLDLLRSASENAEEGQKINPFKERLQLKNPTIELDLFMEKDVKARNLV